MAKRKKRRVDKQKKSNQKSQTSSSSQTSYFAQKLNDALHKKINSKKQSSQPATIKSQELPKKPAKTIEPAKATKPQQPAQKITKSGLRVYEPESSSNKPQKSFAKPSSPVSGIKKKKPAPVIPKKQVDLGIKQIPQKSITITAQRNLSSQGDTGGAQVASDQKTSLMGHDTQVHKSEENLKEADIVIGFDFGTSSTKVVVRDSVRRTAYAIPFNSNSCPGNPYLSPTKLYISQNGRLSLSAGDFPITDLKMNFMRAASPFDDFLEVSEGQHINIFELTAGYVALVLQQVRCWFLKETKEIYSDTKIHWWINIGIPSRNYDDENRRKTFMAMLLTAWKASLMEGEFTIFTIQKAFDVVRRDWTTLESKGRVESLEDGRLHPDNVSAHPEVIMEIVGYANSPLRTEGDHLLVDIGATTLDVAMFIIHKHEGEDVFPLLETKVDALGTMRLHDYRISCLAAKVERNLSDQYSINATDPLPVGDKYTLNIEKKDIRQIDNDFGVNCLRAVNDVLLATKKRRDPRSRVWESKLPVFLCGGGSGCYLYKETIKKSEESFVRAFSGFQGFDYKVMRMPESLEAPELNPVDYHRLAVAYGLSFPADEIGQVIPQSQIKDITVQEESKVDITDWYVGSEMC